MLGLQMLAPAGVSWYTVQYGRWMAREQNALGAYTCYVLAALCFGITGWVLIRNTR